MTRTAWLLLLALQLPAGDPVRYEAVEALATGLALEHQAWLEAQL